MCGQGSAKAEVEIIAKTATAPRLMPLNDFMATPLPFYRFRLSAAILATRSATLKAPSLFLQAFLGEIGRLDHSSEPICDQQITTRSKAQTLQRF